MPEQHHPIRVLIAKPGLDGHEMGAKLVARVLRDAGMEVIYTGPRQSPEMIVSAALQEDVDVIGLSFLSGSHLKLCARIVKLLKENRLDHIAVIVGGIIPHQDLPQLKAMGICHIFGPGSDHRQIIACVKESVKREPRAV